MQTMTQRPNRRPKLFLPLFLSGMSEMGSRKEQSAFPLSPDQLRRTVAEMIG